MSILSRLFGKMGQTPVAPPAQEEKKTSSHNVAGTNYRQAAIKSLGTKNPDFALTKAELFKRGLDGVFEYTFSPKKAELVPEPDNPKDPNAIKVVVDGVHVGYIKAGSCARVHKMIREDRIEKIEARIFGGASKYLYTDDADPKKLSDYTLERSDGSFGVQLTITEAKNS